MSGKPRLLDLFCGAGGAAMGYAQAGFEVVGVDLRPQPHYPFEFHQADAFEFMQALVYGSGIGSDTGRLTLSMFDSIHASPPCQAYSRAKSIHRKPHADLIPATRKILQASGLPYVIENVVLAPLRADLTLCGTMFGLPTRRHRLFESNVDLSWPPFSCCCRGEAAKGNLFNLHNSVQRRLYLARQGFARSADALRDSLGVPWMNMDEAQEAIPPAYTEWVGRQLMVALGHAEGTRESLDTMQRAAV